MLTRIVTAAGLSLFAMSLSGCVVATTNHPRHHPHRYDERDGYWNDGYDRHHDWRSRDRHHRDRYWR